MTSTVSQDHQSSARLSIYRLLVLEVNLESHSDLKDGLFIVSFSSWTGEADITEGHQGPLQWEGGEEGTRKRGKDESKRNRV